MEQKHKCKGRKFGGKIYKWNSRVPQPRQCPNCKRQIKYKVALLK